MNQSAVITFKQDKQEGYRLEAEMIVDLPREQVFDFFADAMELERITPPWLNFSVLTEQPIELKQGTLLDYRLKLHQIPIRWRTEICVWERPFRFVDQQLKGPYKRWFHEHTFEKLSEERTLVKDNVHYIPRGGSLIHRLMVKPDLEKIFRFRQDRLAEIFADKIAKQDSALNLPPSMSESALANGTETARELNP